MTLPRTPGAQQPNLGHHLHQAGEDLGVVVARHGHHLHALFGQAPDAVAQVREGLEEVVAAVHQVAGEQQGVHPLREGQVDGPPPGRGGAQLADAVYKVPVQAGGYTAQVHVGYAKQFQAVPRSVER